MYKSTLRRDILTIEKMDCPTEEALIRARLSTLPGVDSLEFNLLRRELTVLHRLSDSSPILSELRAIGMDASSETKDAGNAANERHPVSRRKWWLIGVSGVSAVLAEVAAWTTGNETSALVIGLALLAIVSGGLETYKKGWIAVKNRNLNINALMSIAVTGAVLIGQWPEAAMVIFLFALAELIESLSLDRARNAIQGLMALVPDSASVRQPDGAWREIEAKQVAVGAIVRVGPGQRIALDGELISGRTTVNQAPITGESMPVPKNPGDRVFAGSINESGAFEFRVTAAANQSTVARIIKAVEEAQGNRAPTQRFVDRFAKIYTPVVFAIAVLIALVPPLMLGLPWMDWIYKALVMLVIACPCALVISTPVTIVSGLAAAARRGILVKGGAYLEDGRSLKVLALDKTGTITHGRPVVTDVVPLSVSVDEGLKLAATLAARSDHPASSAVSTYWRERFGEAVRDDVREFAAITGRGVKGTLGGRWLFLGNHRLVEDLGICTLATEAELDKLESQGKTAIVLCDMSTPLLLIGVADTVRETSRQAIGELHGLGVRSMMLTGDNAKTARVIADAVDIDDARGELLPEDKLKAIEDNLETYGAVGMVGDGINDAPALARSTIGFAMGAAGSDTAIESADVALMDDDLRKIPEFIRLSRRAHGILVQNISLALGIKAVFFGLALAGVATLWMAVFADMGASLIVVFNGLRLLQHDAPESTVSNDSEIR
jgi:Cd2+/Zn2+-exporting ATPase